MASVLPGRRCPACAAGRRRQRRSAAVRRRSDAQPGHRRAVGPGATPLPDGLPGDPSGAAAGRSHPVRIGRRGRHAIFRQRRVHRPAHPRSIVNLARDIAQQGIASVEHIDPAVRLGLGYPLGPLEWGDRLSAGRGCASSNACMRSAATRAIAPSPWLRRRAQLGAFLRQPDSPLAS
ncbi:3-hydroxyacyl-CoA dehydrogenase family protein [Pseudomonas aeruginosa]|nr:3-hydroxyacyl-CoA dehydrogenase family protein [Pseudomonas aeruginosa]